MSGARLIAVPVLSIEAVPAPALLHLSDWDREVSILGYAWLYRAESQAAWTLIDTGTEAVAGVNLGRAPRRQWRARPLVEALGQHGVATQDVGDVVLTHLHHDHCGSIEQFPTARWHVPAVEWRFVNDPANDDLVREPVFPKPLFARMGTHGVVEMSDGDAPVPGLRVIHLGGHTVGTMAVEVLDRHGKPQVVLGGDVMPLAENLRRTIAPGTLWHWGECQRALRRLAEYRVPVLASHDPQLLEQYPQGVVLHD
mgnify:CR=1 FL=1